MPFIQTTATNLIVTLTLMFVLWLISLIRKDSSIVDPFWGFGFAVIAWVTFWSIEIRDARAILLLTLTTIWGLRLSLYLAWRNRGKEEDRRYRAMRDKHGKDFWWVSLVTIFLLQGLIMWFVSLVQQAGMHQSQNIGLGWMDGIGFLVWLVGMLFESIGDLQMQQFKADPSNRGKVMNRGLWRYSRHPNYFGDFCVWWGLFLIAAAAGAGWTIFSPLLMSLLLLKVSGVTLLESDIQQRRPEYESYQKQTNAFFPGPPRDSAV